MIITSLTSVAVSFRSARPTTGSPTRTPAVSATDVGTTTSSEPTDTVELSQPPAVAPVPDPAPASKRSETLLRTLDTDRDGLISKEEFTNGAIELLKRASVRFHHQHVGKGQGIEKRDETWTRRLEDVFAAVDANHDGTIDASELTSALPKPSQRPVRRQPQSGQETAPATPTDTPSVAVPAVVTVAIQQYTFVEGSKSRGTRRARVAKV